MRTLRWLTGAALTGAVAVGCGEPFGVTGGTTTSGTGDATTTGTTGAGGATSTASAGTGSGGGSGGGGAAPCTPGDLDTCGTRFYCNADTLGCSPCDDFTRFEFDKPVALGPGGPLGAPTAFPRVGLKQLYFSYDAGMLVGSEIGHADSVNGKWGLGVPDTSPINTMNQEMAPLFLAAGDALLLQGILLDKTVKANLPVLVFDSDRIAPGTPQVFAVNPGQPAVSQLNLKGGAVAMYFALAYKNGAARAWYMAGTTTAEVSLVTATLGDAPVQVGVSIKNCHARGKMAPWVTPDGKHLLFYANDRDPMNCDNPLGMIRHLFYADLDPASGQQVDKTEAQPIFPDDAGKDQITPSLSADSCRIYFSEAANNKATLYTATRR